MIVGEMKYATRDMGSVLWYGERCGRSLNLVCNDVPVSDGIEPVGRTYQRTQGYPAQI